VFGKGSLKWGWAFYEGLQEKCHRRLWNWSISVYSGCVRVTWRAGFLTESSERHVNVFGIEIFISLGAPLGDIRVLARGRGFYMDRNMYLLYSSVMYNV